MPLNHLRSRGIVRLEDATLFIRKKKYWTLVSITQKFGCKFSSRMLRPYGYINRCLRIQWLFYFYTDFFSKIDVKLYFHGPDQFLDLSGRMGYKLYKGEIMQSQITVTDITILERDVKKDENDPNYKKGQKTCSNELYDDCIYNMLARTMREDTKDNCTVPYIRDDSNICTNPQVFGFCQG